MWTARQELIAIAASPHGGGGGGKCRFFSRPHQRPSSSAPPAEISESIAIAIGVNAAPRRPDGHRWRTDLICTECPDRALVLRASFAPTSVVPSRIVETASQTAVILGCACLTKWHEWSLT